MLKPQDLRIGNYLLHKINARILITPCTVENLQSMTIGSKDFYPVALRPELLQKIGFTENSKYALLPHAHEYRFTVAVNGSNNNEIAVYIKSNKEIFGRVLFNGLPASNNFYYLHQLQNIYFALTGEELSIKI